MSNKLNFGLVGAGTHGRGAVIPGFARSQSCKLVAVADPCEESLSLIEDRTLRRYTSLPEMLETEKLDAIYIATLAPSHCELSLAALEAGAHVVCEKPMASTAEEAQRMLDAARRAKREIAIMFESRFHSHNQTVREWINSGVLGRIEAIHVQSFGKHPLTQPRRTNLLDAAGCLDCGIHTLDLIRHWLGGGHWETIHALGTWFDEAVKCPPHIGILARLDNGVMVTFEDSFSYGYRVESEPRTFGKSTLAIVGTKGVITDVPHPQPGYQLITDERREWTPFEVSYHYDEIPKVLDLFAQMLQGEPPDPRLPLAIDGLEAQRIVDEVNRQCVATAPPFSPVHHL